MKTAELRHEFNEAQTNWLRDTAEAVRQHPDTVDMNNWLRHEDEDELKEHDGYCGTSACMAGHLALTAGLPPLERLDKIKPSAVRADIRVHGLFKQGRHVADVVARLLGMSFEGAYTSIFDVAYWPSHFREVYKKNRAEGLASLLDHMAEVGGIDW